MAAWNIVLRDFKEPNDPDEQHKDVEAVFRVAETKCGSNGRKGRKPLHMSGSPSDRAQLNGRQGKDRNGDDEQPCKPAEKDLGCHGGRFNQLLRDCAWLFCARDLDCEGYIIRRTLLMGSERQGPYGDDLDTNLGRLP